MLDLEKVVVKDGKLEGLEDQLVALRKSDAYLFEDIQKTPTKIGGLDDSILGKTPQEPTSTKRWNAHKQNKLS